MSTPVVAPVLDDVTVRGLARRVRGGSAGRPLRWDLEPLVNPLHPASRLYRLRVSDRPEGAGAVWTVILKVVPPRPTAEQRREAHIYRSAMLDALPPGLRAPRCWWVQERADGSTWLWLEEVSAGAAHWSVARLALAAQHLGRWNGSYLAGAPLPARPYLSSGWLAAWIEANAPAIARLQEARREPPVLRAYAPEVCDRILSLWEHRVELLAGLARLPSTLCHHDAHPGNLVASLRDGREETVLLDWQFAGPGAVGGDAAPLLGATLTEGTLAASQAAPLDRAISAGYLAGLREAGWAGDERLARAGYAGVAGLRYTVGSTRFLLPYLGNPPALAGLEARLGLAAGSLAPTLGGLFPVFLALADESLALLRAAGLLGR